MEGILERLKRMENKKLIDVVKNYRQYGYSDELKNEALIILKSRGIDEFELRLTGNFQNSTYDRAFGLYDSFRRNSRIAFGLYLYLIFGNILLTLLFLNWSHADLFLSITNVMVLLGYLFFLLKSFMDQSNFYKALGKSFGADGAIIFFLIGMPLYIFMYFYFRKQMKEQMATIQ